MLLDMTTLDLLEHPWKWPYQDVLPVKRYRKGEMIYGTIRKEDLTTVYLIGLFSQIGTKTPREVFQSTDDLLEAGWRVD